MQLPDYVTAKQCKSHGYHTGAACPRCSEAGTQKQDTKPECVARDEPLAKDKVEKRNSPRFRVHIISYRRRLLDEDNLCGKYHVDLLRYSLIIPQDSPEHAKLSIGQVKVKTKEEEKTVIEVEIISPQTSVGK